MNRRDAIFNVLKGSIGIATLAGGYGVYFYNKKKTDLSYLHNYKELLKVLTDIIIPETTSPGAVSANVHEFIISMINDLFTEKEQQKFLKGLMELESQTISRERKSFIQCSKIVQYQILRDLEKKDITIKGNVRKLKERLFGKSFFMMLKEYTTIGYCTSQVGATQGLAYNLVPGKYIGITEYKTGQRSWATS